MPVLSFCAVFSLSAAKFASCVVPHQAVGGALVLHVGTVERLTSQPFLQHAKGHDPPKQSARWGSVITTVGRWGRLARYDA